MRAALPTLALSALVLLGCGDDPDDSFADLGEERVQAEVEEAFTDVLTEAEQACVTDVLVADDVVTIGDMENVEAEMTANSGPVFELFRSAMTTCVNHASTDAPSAPIEGTYADELVRGLRAGAPELTDEQGRCFVDALAFSAFDLRDVVLTPYYPELQARFEEILVAAAGTCVPPA